MGVYRRGKSQVYYMDFKFNNQRIFKSTGKRNKTEAKAVEAEERRKLEFEAYASPAQKRAVFTLTKAIDRLWEERWKRTRRGGELEKNRLLKIAGIIGEEKTLDQIEDDDIEKVKRHLRAEKLTPATINRYMTHLKCLLRTARDKWRIVNSVPYIEIPKEKNGRIIIIEEDEEADLIKWLRENDYGNYADLFEALIDTGARLGELLACTAENVDTRKRELALYPEQTKSSEPRNVPLTDRAYDIFTKRIGNVKGARLWPFERWAADRAFAKAKKAIGLQNPKLVVHCLRHTFASRLINSGVDIYTLKELMGHSNITVTERYAHLATHKLRSAISNLKRNSDGK